MLRRKFLSGAIASAATALTLGGLPALAEDEGGKNTLDKFSENEIVSASADFFGITSEAAAKVVQRVFKDLGQPNGYIKGNEGSGAFIVGLRYGAGWLVRKNYAPQKIYWRGPSVGFDFGGNASKVFTLIYNMDTPKDLYHHFPGVEGSIYFVAGIGVLYMRDRNVTIAPMRTGVGLRSGVNAQYQEFTPKRDWFPF